MCFLSSGPAAEVVGMARTKSLYYRYFKDPHIIIGLVDKQFGVGFYCLVIAILIYIYI